MDRCEPSRSLTKGAAAGRNWSTQSGRREESAGWGRIRPEGPLTGGCAKSAGASSSMGYLGDSHCGSGDLPIAIPCDEASSGQIALPDVIVRPGQALRVLVVLDSLQI